MAQQRHCYYQVVVPHSIMQRRADAKLLRDLEEAQVARFLELIDRCALRYQIIKDPQPAGIVRLA